MNQELLKEAIKEKGKRNVVTTELMDLPISDFLLNVYINCTPNVYGDLFPKKIVHDLNQYVSEMPGTFDKGDIHINGKTTMEVKISYKNKNGSYTIANIRPWQSFDNFVLCFVDTDNDFKHHMYCVPKETITNNSKLHLTGMNGVKKINEQNTFVATRTSIKHDDLNWVLKNENLLKGKTYGHLKQYIKNQYKKNQ